jgi:hypothetical protein
MMCPICGFDKSSNFIVDLYVCEWCNHIFKNIEDVDVTKNDSQDNINLHFCNDPVNDVRTIMEQFPDEKYFCFKFPSLMFETFEIHPIKIYNHTYNHYFNQMSLMILLKRCKLIPETQTNFIQNKKCFTDINCRRQTKEEQEDVSNMHTSFFDGEEKNEK